MKLSKNTVGSVIKPGETVVGDTADVGRTDDRRQGVAARHRCRQGRAGATLRLTALNARTTPQIAAKVSYVSADRFIDPQYQGTLSTPRVLKSRRPARGITAGQIQPGMPVDAYIKTGERTFLEYLVRPIQDSFAKAFREE